MKFSFDMPPEEAIAFLEAKKPQLHFDYDEIMHAAHHKAFTVAKVVKLDLLSDIQESLVSAQKEGKSFEAWRKELLPTLGRHGWLGDVEVVNPETGEVKQIHVGSRRLRTIYDTNMRTSYAVGRYTSQMLSDAEYLRYSAILDARTRPKHTAMHGIILPKTHPWWDTNYPPNGWRCRCKAVSLTATQLKSRGLSVYDGEPPNIATRDWAYHPGKTDSLMEAYQAKVAALDCKEKNARQKTVPCGFVDAAKEEFYSNQKTLGERAATFVSIKELFALPKESKKSVELCKSDLFGEEKRVLLSSETVGSHGHHPEIGAFEYSLIPRMLGGRAFIQKEKVVVIVKKLGKCYRVALKDIKSADEIYIQSLVRVSDCEKEIRKLSKYKEIKR